MSGAPVRSNRRSRGTKDVEIPPPLHQGSRVKLLSGLFVVSTRFTAIKGPDERYKRNTDNSLVYKVTANTVKKYTLGLMSHNQYENGAIEEDEKDKDGVWDDSNVCSVHENWTKVAVAKNGTPSIKTEELDSDTLNEFVLAFETAPRVSKSGDFLESKTVAKFHQISFLYEYTKKGGTRDTLFCGSVDLEADHTNIDGIEVTLSLQEEPTEDKIKLVGTYDGKRKNPLTEGDKLVAINPRSGKPVDPRGVPEEISIKWPQLLADSWNMKNIVVFAANCVTDDSGHQRK
jgi:hypothetical protein